MNDDYQASAHVKRIVQSLTEIASPLDSIADFPINRVADALERVASAAERIAEALEHPAIGRGI
jgi:hypothetical protein